MENENEIIFVWALSCGSFELAFGVSFQKNFDLCFFGFFVCFLGESFFSGVIRMVCPFLDWE
jgi:hypothetical protein